MTLNCCSTDTKCENYFSHTLIKILFKNCLQLFVVKPVCSSCAFFIFKVLALQNFCNNLRNVQSNRICIFWSLTGKQSLGLSSKVYCSPNGSLFENTEEKQLSCFYLSTYQLELFVVLWPHLKVFNIGSRCSPFFNFE